MDAYGERLPPSLLRHFEESEHYKEGLVLGQDVKLFLLALSPSMERYKKAAELLEVLSSASSKRVALQRSFLEGKKEGCEEEVPEFEKKAEKAFQEGEIVDWFWYNEKFRGFPMPWRRGYGPDPPVYDASLLIGTLYISLRTGEFTFYGEALTQKVFLELLRYGPRSWQRAVLQEAQWMPLNRSVYLTEKGVELLLRIAPLPLRKLMLLTAEEDMDTTADLLELGYVGEHRMWLLKGYDEGEQTYFQLSSLAKSLGASKRMLKRFMKEHPELLKASSVTPGGFFEATKPRWFGKTLPSFLEDAEKAEKVSKKGYEEAKTREKETSKENDEEEEKKATLAAQIEEANEVARKQRRERRRGKELLPKTFVRTSLGTDFTTTPTTTAVKQKLKSESFLEKTQPGETHVETFKGLLREKKKFDAETGRDEGAVVVAMEDVKMMEKASSTQQREGKKTKTKKNHGVYKKTSSQNLEEEKEAFLRECRLGIEAAKTKEDAVHEDPFPEIERRLQRGLVAARRREKRLLRAETLDAAKKRASEILLP